MRHLLKLTFTGALFCASIAVSHGALVIADAVTTSTGGDFKPIGNIISTDGMVDNGAPGLTIDDGTGTSFNNSWITAGSGLDYFAAQGPITLTFTFTTAQDDISGIAVWSYSHSDANALKNSISAGTVEFFDAGDVSLGAPQAFTSGADNSAGTLTTFGTDYDGVAKAVVTITDNHDDGGAGGDRVASALIAFDNGTVPDPILKLPASITIANNGVTETIQVTMTNDGATQLLSVSAADVTGLDKAAFTVLTNLTSPLDITHGGGTATLDIEFDPSKLTILPGTPIEATLEVVSNDPVSMTRMVPIDGVVRDPWMKTVTSDDPGPLPAGTGVHNFTVDVDNLGASLLTVNDGYFVDGTRFSVVDDLAGTPLEVAAGGTGQVNLSFDGTGAAGVFTDTLELLSDDPVSGGATISYTVTVARDPEISVPATVDRADTTSLDPQLFTIQVDNAGASNDLTISSAMFVDGDTAHFSVTGFDSPISAPGGSGDIDVTFDPLGLYGTFSATLEIQSTDLGAPVVKVEVNAAVIPASPNPFSPMAVDDTGGNTWNWPAGNLITGTFVPTLDDAPGGTGGNWVTNPSAPDYFASGPTPVLVFDMGADVDLRLLYYWAYSAGVSPAVSPASQGNSAGTFSLEFATAAEGTGGFGTSITLNPTIAAAPAEPSLADGTPVPQPVQIFDLGQTVKARYVRMTITDNHYGEPDHAGGDRVGIDEIAFDSLSTGTPYGNWVGALGDPDPTLDYDKGGLATGIEWVTGGNPDDGSDDPSVAPTFDNATDPDDFLFVFRRRDEAEADSNTTIVVEYGTDLDTWRNTADHGAADGVTVDDSVDLSGGFHEVTVAIPRTLASPDGKLFARLSVTVVIP